MSHSSMSLCFCFMFLLLSISVTSFTVEPNLANRRCLASEETPSWNRTFHFNNRSLNLTLELTDKPSHWILNYIFGILAHERLGYQNIAFDQRDWDRPEDAINRLACLDAECNELPEVHINLNVWLPLGTTASFWAPTSKVTDHGPLGPVSRWAVLSDRGFVNRLFGDKLQFQHTCSRSPWSSTGQNPRRFVPSDSTCSSSTNCNGTSGQQALLRFLIETLNISLPPDAPSPVTVNESRALNTFLLSWYPNGFTLPSSLPNLWLPDCDLTVTGGNRSTVQFVTHSWLPPDSQFTPSPRRSDSFGPYCRFESHQATKLTWAKLQTAVPLLHQLVSHLRLSQSEYDELLSSAFDLNRMPNQDLKSGYYDIACRWVRLHRSRWKTWTDGWDVKQNLTVAGLFTFYGKWVIPNLKQIALDAIEFVNKDPAYFGNSEYSLTMVIRNLTCVQDVVLNDYFDLVMSSAGKKLIGVIAALCSDSIEPVVEVANFRRQLIISPTVESARFVDLHKHRYFFRTVPSMSHASLILIRFFRHWHWRRVALFRKDNHFFDPRVFQFNGIDVIADFEMKESQLNFGLVKQGLEKMSEHNSRIFIVEYFARGTALVLCAAYRLGFYFDAGYVWFLNPWLSKDWWKSPDILPEQCTLSEMANITSWTFTLEHQVMRTVLYPNTREATTDPEMVKRVTRQSSEDHSEGENVTASASDLKNQFHQSDYRLVDGADILENHNYAVYTWESVIVLAQALVHLLRENPSAMSVFETVQVAEAYQRFVASTDISYTTALETFLSYREQPTGDVANVNGLPVQVSSDLRFNRQNERAANFWLLKQHRGSVTSSIIRWSVLTPSTVLSSLSNGTTQPELSSEKEDSSALMGEALLEPVNWGRNGGPPGDGSQTAEHCAFLWISRILNVSCSTATIISVPVIVVLCVSPVVVGLAICFHRKLKEAERLIRKPYEDLCAELIDIDIPCSDIVLNRRVGQGAFGMVYGGEAKRNGRWEAVAVKVIGGQATYKGKTGFLWEAKVMRSLEHKNVVRLIGICLRLKENDLYLIMEFMLLGDLKTYLLSRRVTAQQFPDHEDIRPSTLTQMAIDIAEGVGYLHSKNLVHRDLACRNCLVGSDRVVKIGDFGLTRELITSKREGYYRSTRNCELPARWMAPEALQFSVSSVQSDVWSYGIVLYEIITFGVFPYDGLSDFEVIERVKRKEFRILSFLPPAAQNTTIARLIDFCCQHQWQQRPESMERIVCLLRKNPECVRPFLTDEPPKQTTAISQLPFQPGAGACIMSEHTLASDGPASNNPPSSIPVCESLSNNHITAVRGFHNTAGSVAGVGRSSLACYSTDSFSEFTTAAPRLLASEGHQQATGRRRHKTAEGSVSLVRGHFLRRGTTSSSSGAHTCHGSEASSNDRSHGDLNQAKSSAALFTLSPLLTHGWVGSQNSPTKPNEPSSQSNTRQRSGTKSGSPTQPMQRDPPNNLRRSLLRNPDSLDDDLMELTLDLSKETKVDNSHELPDLIKSSSSMLLKNPRESAPVMTNGPMDHTGTVCLRSEKDSKKQPNGILSSTLRSLSAEYLTLEPNQANPGSECTKSAPEGHISAYVHNVALKAVTEVDQAHLDGPSRMVTKKTPRLTSDCSVRGHPWNPSPLVDSRPIVNNASHLFRSVIRAIWRNNNTNKSGQPSVGTLRTTKSSTSCRALGAREVGCTSQSNPDVEACNVSTSCPPLLMPQFSFLNSRVSDRPDKSTYSRVSVPAPPVSAPPVQRSVFQQSQHQTLSSTNNNTNSLGNFNLTNPNLTRPLNSGSHVSLSSLSQPTVFFSADTQFPEPPSLCTKQSDATCLTLPTPSSHPSTPSTFLSEPARENTPTTTVGHPNSFYLV